MSQHDLTIANQGFPAFRADLNDALQALGSCQSGTSAPSPTFANQLWCDTTNNILKIRNEDNDAWISIATLDQSGDLVALLVANTVNSVGDSTISGLTVGKGNNALSANTAFGISALGAATTGNYATAFGYRAGLSQTTGSNEFFGAIAGQNTTTGTGSVYLGSGAGYTNTTGGSNVAVGNSALFSNTTASGNTAVGYQAGYSNTTARWNTFIGSQAGYGVTTGEANTFVGNGYSPAGISVTTGSKNTILGGYSGNQGGLDIRTASNYIVLSDGDGNPRGIFDNNGNFLVGTTSAVAGNCILTAVNSVANHVGYFRNTQASQPYGIYVEYTGSAPNGTGNAFIRCGDTAADRFWVRSNGGVANYSANNVNLSDERTKKDIKDAENYLDKICSIPVRTFLYKDQTDDQLNLGVIAQEVEKVAPELVDANGYGETPEGEIPLKAIYQTDLVYALMKSIQELKAEVDTLKTQLVSK